MSLGACVLVLVCYSSLKHFSIVVELGFYYYEHCFYKGPCALILGCASDYSSRVDSWEGTCCMVRVQTLITSRPFEKAG